jgi:phosphopantothenoylcysteine decarboxylase/phosphopantothenate--cysteine ligase
VITAGPTYEPLDNVRRLTNFSTGQLGSELAGFLMERGHTVILLLGEHATYRGELKAQVIEHFATTADLEQRLRALRNRPVDAVFHAAAVSDFKFGRIWLRSENNELKEIKSGKISTRRGTLVAELVPTAKIIVQLRDWFPSARLVGWKFEVDGNRERVIELARSQITECRSDACIANGPAYGPGFGVVRPGGEVLHVEDKHDLFKSLSDLIQTSR